MSLLRLIYDWWVHVFDKPDSYVALFTALLFVSTTALWWSTRQLWSVTKVAAEHIPRVERAYFSGGGPLIAGGQQLAFTIDNYGKTPGVLVEYAVEFCPLNNIPPVPAYLAPNYQRTRWHGVIKPDTLGLPITAIPIPNIPRPILIYGRYWYRDIWNKPHDSGFVLVAEAGGTHGFVPANIPMAFTDSDIAS